MDDRAIDWTKLVLPNEQFAVGACPDGLRSLLGPRVASEAPAYVAWGAAWSQLPSTDRYHTLALLNSRGVTVSALEAAGFQHTAAYTVIPSFQDARLLLPLRNARVATAGLGLLSPTRLAGRARKNALQVAARVGGVRYLGDSLILACREEPPLQTAIQEILGLGPVEVALLAGTPSQKRKPTLQIMDSRGNVAGYGKLASPVRAKQALQREVVSLQALACHPKLAMQVPRLLGQRTLSHSLLCVISAGPTKRAPLTFGTAHHEFLRTLQAVTAKTAIFGRTSMWENMMSGWQRLEPRLDERWQRRVGGAIEELRATTAQRELCVGTAHRDFTPWNTRLLPDGRLFVFDWELAETEASPLYDFFHFHLVGQWSARGREAGQTAPGKLLDACERWQPGLAPSTRSDLLLAYLVDRSLSRLEYAMWRSDDGDSFLGLIGDMIDQRGTWSELGPVG